MEKHPFLFHLPPNCPRESLHSQLPLLAINTFCSNRLCVTFDCIAIPIIVHCVEVDVLWNLSVSADMFKEIGLVVKEDICFFGAAEMLEAVLSYLDLQIFVRPVEPPFKGAVIAPRRKRPCRHQTARPCSVTNLVFCICLPTFRKRRCCPMRDHFGCVHC